MYHVWIFYRHFLQNEIFENDIDYSCLNSFCSCLSRFVPVCLVLLLFVIEHQSSLFVVFYKEWIFVISRQTIEDFEVRRKHDIVRNVFPLIALKLQSTIFLVRCIRECFVFGNPVFLSVFFGDWSWKSNERYVCIIFESLDIIFKMKSLIMELGCTFFLFWPLVVESHCLMFISYHICLILLLCLSYVWSCCYVCRVPLFGVYIRPYMFDLVATKTSIFWAWIGRPCWRRWKYNPDLFVSIVIVGVDELYGLWSK